MPPQHTTSPGLNTLEAICRKATRAGASDVHLKSGTLPHFRVDGVLQPMPRAPRLGPEQIAQVAWDMMSKMQREHFKTAKDIDLSIAIAGAGRFRANIYRQRGQVGIALRAIPNKISTIDDLNLPAVLKRIAGEPRGLILVTGTTGSGKSTTMAALVEEINNSSPAHIITIEDPIEFNFRDRKSIINQREVGTDSRDFPTALRAALRQDPDVILVGELRDLESVEMALAAAETGHLVMSTVHSLNAPETINRILNFFEPHHHAYVRSQLSTTLTAVISQRLVPRKGGGRLAAMEIMLNTGSVSECILDPLRIKEIPDLVAQGHDQYGSQTFDQALFDYIEKGLIEARDALHHATSPDNLLMKIRGIGN